MICTDRDLVLDGSSVTMGYCYTSAPIITVNGVGYCLALWFPESLQACLGFAPKRISENYQPRDAKLPPGRFMKRTAIGKKCSVGESLPSERVID